MKKITKLIVLAILMALTGIGGYIALAIYDPILGAIILCIHCGHNLEKQVASLRLAVNAETRKILEDELNRDRP